MSESRLRTVLLLALPTLLGHALLPLDQFIHRGDDTYYYLKVALDFPRYGFWTFDGIHPTTGFQPLWGILLTAVAYVYVGLGGQEPDTYARICVALTALVHFASCLVLYHLLARRVSVVTGLAAAGAFLFCADLVWGRVWGMENSIYALFLLATVAYYDLAFSARRTARGALIVGLLLGLTGLSRLNAFLLVPCLLLHLLLSAREEPIAKRLRLAVLTGGTATLLFVAYVTPMYLLSGRPLPVSGAAKAIQTTRFMADNGIDSRLSPRFAKTILARSYRELGWFVTSRVTDGAWLAGSRLLFRGDSSVPPRDMLSKETRSGKGPKFDPALLLFPALVGVLLLGPGLVGGMSPWASLLGERLRSLSRFWYVLLFAVADTVVSVLLYPTEVRYAMVRWWWAPQETIVVVVSAAVVAAGLGLVARRFFAAPVRSRLLLAMLSVLVVFHVGEFVHTYWRGQVIQYDWKLSWNDDSYRAAEWVSANVPEQAKVGSWNAGVLGYYAKRRVVNLDGLINGPELLPHLRDGTTGRYIREQGIEYLSDIEGRIKAARLGDDVVLTQVFTRYSPLMLEDYKIYKVAFRD